MLVGEFGLVWFGLVGLSQNSKAGVRILSLLRFRYRALSPLIFHIAHHLNSQAYHICFVSFGFVFGFSESGLEISSIISNKPLLFPVFILEA